MSEQFPGSVPTQDESAITAEYYEKSAAAASDMLVNHNPNSPIQQGVEHGPHMPIEAGDPMVVQLGEHAANVVDAKMDGFISGAAKNQLLKENQFAAHDARTEGLDHNRAA